MKKLFKTITIKRLGYASFAISWVFFLTILFEIKDDLNTIVSDRQDYHYFSSQLENIDAKLKYNYNSTDVGDYEAVEHYRYNTETSKIETKNYYGGWTID
jgi:hypothetical protein